MSEGISDYTINRLYINCYFLKHKEKPVTNRSNRYMISNGALHIILVAWYTVKYLKMIFCIYEWTFNPSLYYNAYVFDANAYILIQDKSMHWDNQEDVTVVIQNKRIAVKFSPMEFVVRTVTLCNFAKLFLKLSFYIIYCVMLIWNYFTARCSIKSVLKHIPNSLFFALAVTHFFIVICLPI